MVVCACAWAVLVGAGRVLRALYLALFAFLLPAFWGPSLPSGLCRAFSPPPQLTRPPPLPHTPLQVWTCWRPWPQPAAAVYCCTAPWTLHHCHRWEGCEAGAEWQGGGRGCCQAATAAAWICVLTFESTFSLACCCCCWRRSSVWHFPFAPPAPPPCSKFSSSPISLPCLSFLRPASGCRMCTSASHSPEPLPACCACEPPQSWT